MIETTVGNFQFDSRRGELVLKTLTEAEMAAAILQTYRKKLEKGSDEAWIFKNEIYKTFKFHPQTMSDFLEKLSDNGCVRWIWTLPDEPVSTRRKLGGPAFRPTVEGQILLGTRLNALFHRLKESFA
jgi:hypothetical protein